MLSQDGAAMAANAVAAHRSFRLLLQTADIAFMFAA